MVAFGGVHVMVLGAVLAAVPALLLVAFLRRWTGLFHAVVVAALLWSLVVIALVTLVPTSASPGIVPADTRLPECSMDYGGPAPDGFWVFGGTQRSLNLALFVPSGVLLVLVAARWRVGVLLAPLGLLALVAYSFLIERTQFEVARIDRACDITDVVDNSAGAVLGFLLGLLLILVLRPWRRRKRSHTSVERTMTHG